MRTRTLLRALSWFSDSVRFSRLFLKNWETQILILKICNWQSTFANLAMFIVRTQINYTFFHKIKLKKIRKTFITKHWYFKIYSNQNTFYYLLEIFGFLPITLKSLYNIVKSCYLIICCQKGPWKTEQNSLRHCPTLPPPNSGKLVHLFTKKNCLFIAQVDFKRGFPKNTFF